MTTHMSTDASYVADSITGIQNVEERKHVPYVQETIN